MAMQDSLRRRGHPANKELNYRNPFSPGSPVEYLCGIPVFQSASGQPLRSGKLEKSIVGLGRRAEFEYNTTPYSLRRGYANVSAEDRRFLMGHKINSDIYSHYHSAVSDVHVQKIFRGVRAGNTAELHGLSLNRIQHLPQAISENGWRRLQQDPEIVQAGLETDTRPSCRSFTPTIAK